MPRLENHSRPCSSLVAIAWSIGAALSGCASRGPHPTPTASPEPATPALVRPHSSWEEAVLYFVVLDRFADGDASNNREVRRSQPGAFHGGDLVGLTEQLDDLARLGVTALWITPVVQNIPGFVTGAGFPDWAYHGYWADDFTTVDPRFGSEEDLARLVAAAHGRGIAVLLDVVYNHVGYGSSYLERAATRAWLRTEEDGTCGQDDLTLCVAGLPDLRTELPWVADHLLEAHLGRAERTDLDGFRLDTVKHVSHEFWREHRRRVDARLGEDFFLLGEVWGGDAQALDPWFAEDELDAGFDFGFSGSVIAFLQGRGRTIAFERYLESRHEARTGHLLAHHLSSHDIPTALSLLDGDLELFRLAAVLQLTVRGIPVVYYGEEVGRYGGSWPENRSDMPWGDRDILPGAGKRRDEGLREDYRRLIAIRRGHPALWRGSHRSLFTDGDLLVFARRDPATGDAVVVALNRGATTATARVPLPEEWSTGARLRDLWNDVEFAAAERELVLELPAHSARIVGEGG